MLPLCLLFLPAVTPGASQSPYLHAPSVTDYAKHDPSGLTILPTGRHLKPVGRHFPVARWPHGLVLSPDGATLFIASDGIGQFVTEWETPSPTITSFSSLRKGMPKRRSNAGGAAFSPDGKKLYWCSRESGEVYVVDVATHTIMDAIALNVEVNGQRFADSCALDVKASADGSSLYCADVTNFRVVVLDAAKRKVVGSVRVGRYPYALAVSASKKTLPPWE